MSANNKRLAIRNRHDRSDMLLTCVAIIKSCLQNIFNCCLHFPNRLIKRYILYDKHLAFIVTMQRPPDNAVLKVPHWQT